jgi:Flp pilus assembly protein TadG
VTQFLADDRGDGDVAGMLFIVPLIFGVVLLFIFLGRQGSAAEGATHAAHVAAVAASHQRDQTSAQAAAHDAAASTLAAAGTACSGGPSVSVTADRWAPGGVVTVDVSCTVATNDLGAIAAPSRTLRGRSEAILDQYRGFGP